MTRRFGNRSTFAVEVGEVWSRDLRIVDLWAGGKRLTTDDDTAFVPSICHQMRLTAELVRRREIPPCPVTGRPPEEIFRRLQADETEFRERYWFMVWSEILDNVSKYAYLDDDLVIVFAFWRATHPSPEDLGKVFTARIPPDEFATTVQEAADLLHTEWAG
ncbi:hypothetical protein [Catellatospora sp. NPDC049133]|jgi:hypothetical protein|uniref:hypothetical protein n=1 Tax=Catellatospora sp. NPDC049133 TaxID=3155499 RepID=UPI00340DA5A3